MSEDTETLTALTHQTIEFLSPTKQLNSYHPTILLIRISDPLCFRSVSLILPDMVLSSLRATGCFIKNCFLEKGTIFVKP